MDAVELYTDRNYSEENIETNMEDDGLLKDEAESSPDKIDRQENGATNQLTGRCTYRLEMVLAMYMISNIMTFPIAQFYVYNQVAKSYGIPNYIQDDNSDICHSKNISNETQAISNIQKEATEQLTYMSFLSSFLAIIPTFFIGYISDRFGRKISFLITIFGLLLHQIIYILVFVLEAPLPFLYIGSALEGLTGYISCAIMTAFIMLADITSPGKERAFRIAVMEGVLASSSALSVLGVGFWIKYSAFLIPMLCSTGLCVVTIIVWIVFVPETRPFVIDQNHERSKFKVLNFNIIKRCFVFYYQDSPEKRRGEMSTLLLILVLAASCLLSKSNVTTLFLLNTPLCWTELHITVVTSLQILVNWVAGILFLRLLQRVMRDVSMLTLGCFVGMVSMVPMALAKQDWMVYLYMATTIVSVIIVPISRSVMSKLSSPEEQGALFAGVAAVEHLGTGCGGLLFGEVYKASVGFFPGLVFFVIVGLMFIAFLLAVFLQYFVRLPRQNVYKEIPVVPED